MPRLLVNRYHISLLLAVMLSMTVKSQTASQYISKGDKEQKDGYHQSAIFFYKKALGLDTNLLEANFQTAESYRKLRNYKRAQAFYEATIAVDGTDRYPEAHLFLGLMLKQQGEYAKAKRSFSTFLSIYHARDDIYRWARDEIASCEWAIEHQNDTAKYEVFRPDSGLNTTHAELSPFLLDSHTIYFSTMRYEKDVIKKSNPVYVEMKKATKDSNIWTPIEMDIPVNASEMHVGNGTFSNDTNRFYFTRCATLGSCSIFVSKRLGAGWGEPTALDAPVNEETSTNTQPTIAQFGDDEYLIFASNRGRGKGGMDLWFVTMKNGEPTTRIRNMGSNVNTDGDEITPYYDSEDSALYFSSNRLMGFGGFDVFKFKGLPGSTNIPENLGTEVNTPADDYYFMGRANDSTGFFASNRISGLKKSGNETCCNDLYRVKLLPPPPVIDTVPEIVADTIDSIPPVIVEVENPKSLEELQTLLPISLYFHNDRPNPRTMDTTTKLTYAQTIEEYLSFQSEYVEAVNRSALSGTMKMKMGNDLQQLFEKELDRSLEQVDKALHVLLVELADSSIIKLAVKGYASPLANSDYNLNLTLRRIASMENYIKQYENGAFIPYLESEQLTIEKIPYGESKASSDVSDDMSDELSAIYSPKAALERRIEILRIERDQ